MTPSFKIERIIKDSKEIILFHRLENWVTVFNLLPKVTVFNPLPKSHSYFDKRYVSRKMKWADILYIEYREKVAIT